MSAFDGPRKDLKMIKNIARRNGVTTLRFSISGLFFYKYYENREFVKEIKEAPQTTLWWAEKPHSLNSWEKKRNFVKKINVALAINYDM